jgi:hypothetical protein
MFGGVDFDNADMIVRVQEALNGSADPGVLDELVKLRRAVSDLIDALATRMRPPRNEALISIFERTLLDSKVLQGSRDIPLGWWEDLGANMRLFYTRVALRIFAEPLDPLEDDGMFPAHTWPYAWYRYSKVEGWQSVFTHAVRDPLFLLPMELPRMILVDRSDRRVRVLSRRGEPAQCWRRRVLPTGASRTIGVGQSHGWSQKIAKTRNDVATPNGSAATRRNRSQRQAQLRFAGIGVSDNGPAAAQE